MHLSGAVLFVALAAATGVLAIRFLGNESLSWRDMNATLLAGTISLSVAVFCHACLTFSVRDACIFFTLSFGISLLAEYGGVHWGAPFGSRYHYHEDLMPRLAGSVPLFIPLSWSVLAYAPLVLLRRFGDDASGDGDSQQLFLKAVLCAIGLMVADLFLDPLATSVQAWTWAEKGQYFGVPFRNYLGWLLVGFLIYTSFFVLRKPRDVAAFEQVFLIDCCFVISCIYLTILAQVAIVQRLDNILPVVLTTVAMAPYLVYWHTKAQKPWAKVECENDLIGS